MSKYGIQFLIVLVLGLCVAAATMPKNNMLNAANTVEQGRIVVIEKPYGHNPKALLSIVTVDRKEYLINANGGIVPLESK